MSEASPGRIEELEARVRRLESEVQELRASADPTAHLAPPLPPLSSLPPPTGSPLMSSPAPDALASPRPVALESETVLKWGGVGLLVLAVGFAVSTAISRGWIGPELQLAGAVGVSLTLIGTGLRLRPTRLPWTHALCSGGIAALFTTVASNLFLEQTNTDVAFTCTVAIGLAGYGLTRLTPSEWVGGATLFGGLAGWLVIADGDPPFTASLAWMAALVAGALAMSLERRWYALRFMGHVVGLLAILGMAGESRQVDEQVLVLIAAAPLFASLVRVPSIGTRASAWKELEIQLSTLAAPWALAVIAIVTEPSGDTSVGWIAITVAGVTGLVGLAIRRWIMAPHFISILIGASVTLSIGMAVLLSGSAAFVALAVQGAGLVVLSRVLGRNPRVLVNAVALLILGAGFVIVNGLDAWIDDVPIGDDIVHLATIGAIAVGGWQTRDEAARKFTAVGALALILLWLGSVLVHLPQGQAAVSVSWAVVGTAVLVVGATRKVPEAGAAGLTVLALTVGKLLTVDLQEVDTLWRAGLFFVVGLAILRLGFLLPRLTGVTSDPSEATSVSAGDEP